MSYRIPDPHKKAFEQFAAKWDAERQAEREARDGRIDRWMSDVIDRWLIPLASVFAWSAVVVVVVTGLTFHPTLTIGLLLFGILIDRKRR